MPGQQEAAQELMLGVLSMGTAPEERGRHVPIQGPPRPLRHPSRSSAGSGVGRPHMRLAEVTVPVRSCLDIAQWERAWQWPPDVCGNASAACIGLSDKNGRGCKLHGVALRLMGCQGAVGALCASLVVPGILHAPHCTSAGQCAEIACLTKHRLLDW